MKKFRIHPFLFILKIINTIMKQYKLFNLKYKWQIIQNFSKLNLKMHFYLVI